MNKKKARTREIRISFALAAIICVILGLLLVFMPNASGKLLCMLVGTGFSVYGLLSITAYLLGKGESAYTPTLFLGICALALGVFSLINPTFLLDFLFTVLGLVVIVISIGGVRRALRLRSFGFICWWAPLMASLATLVLALSVILFPGLYGNLLMTLCGVLLLSDGVCDLVTLYWLSRYLRR